MSLAPGVRLGAYEVLSLIGAGGMGEVYRARDSKLNRDVAIAVAPDGRFLMNVAVEGATQPPITIVLNWDAGLKK